MKKIKKTQVGIIMALAGIVLLVATGSSSALPICPAPGNTDITASCELDQNWTVGGDEYGYKVIADNVVIDGKGYKITGDVNNSDCTVSIMDGYTDESHPAGPSGIIIDSSQNVTVKDLRITNFCTGTAVWYGHDHTITDCVIHDNGKSMDIAHGIHLVGSDHCDITKNEICNQKGTADIGDCGSGGNGISMFGGDAPAIRGNYNNITRNYLHNNAKCGLHVKKKGMYNSISCNKVTNNTGAGIMLECKKSNHNVVEWNNISEKALYGIYIGGSNNTIRYNTVTNNRYYGINMGRSDGSCNNKIYGNMVCGNGDTDITVFGPECYGNHGYNNTCNTTSYYNDDGTTGCTYDCEYSEVGCVAEDGTVFGCGDTVTKNCTFNGDMDCSTARYGLIIGADNITIDGAGYTLERADPGECTLCPSAGIINKGYSDVVITNLEIEHFCTGIYLTIEGGNVVCRNTIENCNIHHNGNATSLSATHGIKMRYVFNSTIRNNSIHDQIAHVDPDPGCEDGGNGLFLYQGEYNNIIENRFYNNQKAGMLIKMKPKYWNISHNQLWNNGQGGIILRCKLCDFNLIEHNNASGNYGSGIFIGGNDNVIRYNTVCNNRNGGHYYGDSVGGHGYGINIGRGDGSLNNTLISNTVCGNDYLDIRAVTGVTGNHGSENTCNTTCNYNDCDTTNCTYSCGTIAPSKGDLNDDGIITPADAVIALQMTVRGEYSEDADVSGDHKVTSLDALLIMQAAAGV